MLTSKEISDRDYFKYGLYAFFIVLFFGLVYFLYLKYMPYQLPCMFQLAFGIYCPGCGGTRAVLALFSGHLLQSLWYHPAVLYTAVIYLGYMISHTISIISKNKLRGWHFRNWYLWAELAIIGANFILKNFLLLVFHISL